MVYDVMIPRRQWIWIGFVLCICVLMCEDSTLVLEWTIKRGAMYFLLLHGFFHALEALIAGMRFVAPGASNRGLRKLTSSMSRHYELSGLLDATALSRSQASYCAAVFRIGVASVDELASRVGKMAYCYERVSHVMNKFRPKYQS